jgi:hypothetical protein
VPRGRNLIKAGNSEQQERSTFAFGILLSHKREAAEKLQIPSSKEVPNPNLNQHAATPSIEPGLELEIWSFFGAWDLELGA